jgi:glycogen debranching enzyme/glycosidase
MTPAPGDRCQRFVGDRICFTLSDREGRSPGQGWQARLRTNLGRADLLRSEILQAHTCGLPLAGASWHDLPMPQQSGGWALQLPLAEVGFFKAKAYLLDPRGWQHWPAGLDVGISVHPDRYRTANILYCAFPRLFGPGRTALSTGDEKLGRTPAPLDLAGHTIIPPSGKLRDLTQQLPHILDTLGCRLLHLLPVNPTPTTYARFGRFGSPYAALDLTAIDPALVVLDKRTTGIDQFRELTYETHRRGARVFLDIVTNHTGWGSPLQEQHPEWFQRQEDGRFVSPGAWGVTWEDLVELKHDTVALWDNLAETFLTWCRRGVDGFRCDAGYKVPVPAWQYIVARVQQEYPETIFLLEGLGGSWAATAALLTEGGMQWAYSELFQNYSGREVAGYLDHSLKQSRQTGLLVHYSETHDNQRLAARGRAWSLLRHRLAALTSVSGGFGFTCGGEWLAIEKIDVHGSTGLAWDNPDNLLPELAALSRLLADHPCFFDGAQLTRLSPPDSPVYALLRQSEEGADAILVLVNTDMDRSQTLSLDGKVVQSLRSKVQSHEPELRSQESGGGSQEPGAGSQNPEVGTPEPEAGGQNPRITQHATRTTPPPSPVTSPPSPLLDLLGQAAPEVKLGPNDKLTVTLAPGAAYGLAPNQVPQGLHGDAYRRARAQAAWAHAALHRLFPEDHIGAVDWRTLAAEVDRSPSQFLSCITHAAAQSPTLPLAHLLPLAPSAAPYPRVVNWTRIDLRRITLVPPGHWLLLCDTAPFRAELHLNGADSMSVQNVESIPVRDGHVACFPPRQSADDATLKLERYAPTDQHIQATLHFLAPEPTVASAGSSRITHHGSRITLPRPTDLVLLTNARGAMARICLDLGRVLSKYDCVLGANLHPTLPVDRHVLVKRIRVWINADGFISPLDFASLAAFDLGPPATWEFVANAGDGRTVEIQMTAAMVDGRNTTVFQCRRPTAAQAAGKQLPAQADVRLTLRLDLEDRNFHWETKRNGGADHHFSTHLHPLPRRSDAKADDAVDTGFIGFTFNPAPERQLRVFADRGCFQPQAEWSENLPHPVEQSRGQVGSGDAFSPGWFDLPLPAGATVTLIINAEPTDLSPQEFEPLLQKSEPGIQKSEVTIPLAVAGSDEAHAPRTTHHASPDVQNPSVLLPPTADGDPFTLRLLRAVRAFVVRRGSGKTVIAGYPWFLDWGRDTFICARGLLAGGLVEEVKQILLTFARFEKDGTLPNTIFGEDASNRDTSDAPLWFALACEELAAQTGAFSPINPVLESIARNYIRGTPNGIRMDPASALIWSPSHFTWMDTNYPAGTPREGYPVEIQALWIRLLRQLARLSPPTEAKRWEELATQALASLDQFLWREDLGYYADVLQARPGQPAAQAMVDDALRSNCLFVISLGLATGDRARRCVEAVRRYLLVPGALRSLAPLPVSVPLPVHAPDGRLLNNPKEPYWGRYEGDEDTRRKPAYHNGTAWLWTFPSFCEALARAWDLAPEAVAAAKAYLGSLDRLLAEGCLGQLPEILDGDTPHTQRGCDAQAWSVTEALRVWKWLGAAPFPGPQTNPPPS